MLENPINSYLYRFADFLKDNDTVVRLRTYQYDELEVIYKELNETIDGYERTISAQAERIAELERR